MVMIILQHKKICRFCNKPTHNENIEIDRPIFVDDFWVHAPCYFRHRNESAIKGLVVARCNSIGDTIAVTPVVAEIRRLHPNIRIDVATMCPDIWENNTKINSVIKIDENTDMGVIAKDYNYVYQAFDTLEQKYIKHYNNHIVAFTSACALKKTMLPSSWGYDVPINADDISNMYDKVKEAGIDLNKPTVLVHPYKAFWETRTWNPENWEKVIERISELGYQVASIGGGREYYEKYKLDNYINYNLLDLYNKLTVRETIALCNEPNVKLFITLDTGALHVAACSKVPILGIFSVIKGYFRTPTRDGIFGKDFHIVENDVCNCTYDSRTFSPLLGIDKCPKKRLIQGYYDFLTQKEMLEISESELKAGLDNVFPETNGITDLPARVEKLMFDYNSPEIACMPSASKVIDSINKLLVKI